MAERETETPRHRVMVCQGSSCRRNGSPELMEQLQQSLSEDDAFEVERYICFAACGVGPNVVVMPDRLWYSFVIPGYVEQITEAMQRGEEQPGLANHVRPEVKAAVFSEARGPGRSSASSVTGEHSKPEGAVTRGST